MPVSRLDAEAFFRNYGEALSGRDTARIADHWGLPCLILSDQGAMPVADRSAVTGFFAASMDQYDRVEQAVATIKAFSAISDTVASCDVRWSYCAGGQELATERGHYALRLSGDSLLIHVFVPRTAS